MLAGMFMWTGVHGPPPHGPGPWTTQWTTPNFQQEIAPVNSKHLMTGPEGNSEFFFPRISMFPENLNVSRGEVEGNIEIRGKQNSLFPKGPVIK